jgi:hypothetical protein
MVWTRQWQRELANLKNRLKTEEIKLGVIYNGGDAGKMESDRNWTETTIQRSRHFPERSASQARPWDS